MLKRILGRFSSVIIIFIGLPIFSWRFRAATYRFFGANLSKTFRIGHGCVFSGPLLNIKSGKNTYVNHNCFFGLEGKIILEDHVRIGPYVRMMTRFHPTTNAIIRRSHGGDIDYDKTIGFGSWVGLGVIILPGVDIAEGCVIGAGSVVTKTTLPNGLYAGSPARRLRDLPVDDIDFELITVH